MLDDDLGEAHTPDVPAGSPLARMRAQRERQAEELAELHVHVPRTTDPSIWVIYRPIDPGYVQDAIEKRQKAHKKRNGRAAPGDDWVVLANADILAEYCLGIYWLDDDEKEHGFSQDAPDDVHRLTYGPELSRALGHEPTSAIDSVRQLFVTGADLVMHAGELATRSGLEAEELEARFRGE